MDVSREQLYCGYKGCLPAPGSRGWYRLPICQGDRLKQFANCATYSNCLCATVLILCKPTNDSQVSRVATATECGKCDKVQPLIEITTHPSVAQPPRNEPACRIL